MITVEVPTVDDGFVIIICQWEDLLDYYDHQNQLWHRTMADQRMDTTKEFFEKITLGTNSASKTASAKFKIPKVMNEEGSQSAARGGKISLPGAGDSQDPGHAPDNKIMRGEKSRVNSSSVSSSSTR